ncbi:DUF1292 domain-containing protein [Paenibacillus sp. SYP-B4298]|uniref:DUF1292 domain-containing protein n=1 Tax=Paenibacillus sp. SYP-B4298 TaxID=2996034 RepID=UPI0022DDD879|nr:DUF1292 domain-containing protein [Paenibacillus sp. SYP-B4298]
MADHGQVQVKRIALLQEAYGRQLELVSDSGMEESYRIAAEFELGGERYAALQTAAMKKNDELAFFRITGAEGELELESIEDEDEWELAAEGYDELMFEEMGLE